MSDRSIASRPSLEQVMAIVKFMEKYPELGMGRLRGLEGRDESKFLWAKLTKTVNGLSGPTRSMKSWIKFWADKKSTVRSKVLTNGVNPNNLNSGIEKKIWDLFLTDNPKHRGKVKQETHYLEENFFNEESVDGNEMNIEENNTEEDPVITFKDTDDEAEGTIRQEVDRQTALMEKLVKVMSDQSAALSQLAQASAVNAQAMERLAEASQIQASAIDRLAGTFDTLSGATHVVKNALVDIDGTMKRFYDTSPT